MIKRLLMKKKQILDVMLFVLLAILSGIMIGMGGTASLYAQHLYGSWGKLIGACLFSLGIFAILTFQFRLFTGMVAGIPDMKRNELWQLPVCFLGNASGVGIVALLISVTPLADVTVPLGAQAIANKLANDHWVLLSLSSSAFCGILITLSVWSWKYVPEKGLSATLGAVFPIIFFAFCGFDHSVANMLNFYYLGELSWQVVGYIALSILGNILGGVAIPLVLKLKDYVNKQENPLS